MFASPTAKKVRAIALAIGVTFVTNYAISFAARSDSPAGSDGNQTSLVSGSSARGSVPTMKPTQRPQRGSVPTVKPSPKPDPS